VGVASNAAKASSDTGDGEPVASLSQAERKEALGRLRQLQAELADVQGETPLILVSVDEQAVGKVVEDWTGIPVGRMVKNEIEAILKLKDTLRERVVGQDHAMEMIARRIQTSRAGLENPDKPIGVFLLCGPSGVGKTETALALAEALYGDEDNVVTINMSEYQEAHTVSTLKGSLAARLRRLWRRRRADRSGAQAPVQRRAAGRGGESAPGRPRNFLPDL
jgi:type VI secretion system protein VasG